MTVNRPIDFLNCLINCQMLKFRKALSKDCELYYEWTNDPEVRKYSYKSEDISFENHCRWFESKLKSNDTILLVFSNEEDENVGQVRIESKENEAIIGISIDSKFRGMGLAKEMLIESSAFYLKSYPQNKIFAFVKKDNFASYKSFLSAGYKLFEECEVETIPSYKLTIELNF